MLRPGSVSSRLSLLCFGSWSSLSAWGLNPSAVARNFKLTYYVIFISFSPGDVIMVHCVLRLILLCVLSKPLYLHLLWCFCVSEWNRMSWQGEVEEGDLNLILFFVVVVVVTGPESWAWLCEYQPPALLHQGCGGRGRNDKWRLSCILQECEHSSWRLTSEHAHPTL